MFVRGKPLPFIVSKYVMINKVYSQFWWGGGGDGPQLTNVSVPSVQDVILEQITGVQPNKKTSLNLTANRRREIIIPRHAARLQHLA